MSGTLERSIVHWLGRLGAASADDVADHFGLSLPSARGRLSASVKARTLRVAPLLRGEPPLYAATRRGLRSVGLEELGPCRISRSGFMHLSVCARIAVAVAHAHPECRLASERELRGAERLQGEAIASAQVGLGRDGQPALHRPDLVLFGPRGPVPIEVELTVKAPRRLEAIVRGWARCRSVEEVVYLAAPGAARAVRRAIDSLSLGETVVVHEIDPHARHPLGRCELAALAPREAIAITA
jgi:hypothetical protein